MCPSLFLGKLKFLFSIPHFVCFTANEISNIVDNQSRESIKNDGKITLPSKVSEIVKITNKNAWSFYGFQQPKPRPNAEKAKKIETRNRFELLTEKQKKGTILCSDVPKWMFVGSDILKTHFSLFGTIKDVCMDMTRSSCFIVFEDEDSAKKNQRFGRQLHNGLPKIGKIELIKEAERKTWKDLPVVPTVKRKEFPPLRR